MSPYDDEILTDTPALYYKEEELPGESPLHDFSGNGWDATIYTDNVRGVPGPIQTDASPKAIAGRAGNLSTPLPSGADPRSNFTLEGWVFEDVDVNYSSRVLIARSGQPGLSGSTLLYLDDHNIAAQITINSVSYSLSAPLPEVSGWYHCALVRNGTQTTLLLMGLVVDTKTVTAHDITISGTDNGWFFGVPATTTVFQGTTARSAVYAHAVTQARLLAHVEAALAETALNGFANAAPTAILYSDLEPDPVSFPFRHNWDDSLMERITFRTAISTAVKGYEATNTQRPKPRREIEISQVLRDNDERQAFRAKLTANQKAKWFIPILEDREWLTTTLAAGSTVMPADSQYRDYEIGSWVELRQFNALGQVEKHEYKQITSLSPLTTTPIVNTYNAGSSIGPARRGILEAQLSPRGHTDAVDELSLTARLIAEDEKVVPNRIIPWTPTITYKSFEVFDPATWQSNEWTELRDYNVQQKRTEVDFNTGPFSVESDQIASYEAFSYRMLIEGRSNQAALLGWFYARAGSGRYLWVPSVQRDFNIVGASGSNLTVAKHNYSDNFAGSEFRRDLALVYNDNSMVLRRITGVSLSGANEILALDNSVPSQTNLRSVSYLRFCRCDGDTLEIARATDTKGQFAWGFRELLSSPT